MATNEADGQQRQEAMQRLSRVFDEVAAALAEFARGIVEGCVLLHMRDLASAEAYVATLPRIHYAEHLAQRQQAGARARELERQRQRLECDEGPVPPAPLLPSTLIPEREIP